MGEAFAITIGILLAILLVFGLLVIFGGTVIIKILDIIKEAVKGRNQRKRKEDDK